MNYNEYRPKTSVSQLIECFWSNILFEEDIPNSFDLIMPEGSTDAIIMIKGNYLRKDAFTKTEQLVEQCSFIPPFKKAVKVYQNPYTTVLGIRFKPGAIIKLTGTSLKELDESVYPLEVILPELADLAMDEVAKGASIQKLIEEISNLLEKMNVDIPNNILSKQFISASIHHKGNVSISDFCSTFNIHKSTLEKSFKHQTGLTPKQYAKITRLNYLLNLILNTTKSMTEISYELGFFDQSHMIRDFSSFAGIAPTDFRKMKLSVPKQMATSVLRRSDYYK